MHYIRLIILVLLAITFSKLKAQSVSHWYSFTDPKSELTGYMDEKGKIMIPAKFGGLSRANVLKNIIEVTEYDSGQSYYLLKNGKKIGRDSLYTWDMTYDFEQEEKIRFRDPKTDKVGFFGANGKISIPAIYDDAQPFRNGIAIVLYNAKRICADGNIYDPKHPCEHWNWDGTTALIDTGNNVIADSLDINSLSYINWYSMKKSDKPADTILQRSYKSNNGHYLSFLDYEKEFKYWFYHKYISSNQNDAELSIFSSVSVEGLFKCQLRKTYSRKNFTETYGNLYYSKLKVLKSNPMNIFIIPEELNLLIYDSKTFDKYQDDGGNADAIRYPAFNVSLTYYKNKRKFDFQEHYSFLRTENGYKLVGVVWKTDKHSEK